MKKLSEMTTEESLDILCAITPYASNIVEDKELIKVFAEKIKLSKNESEEKFKEKTLAKGVEKLIKFIPLVLKKHRDDIFGILSILSEKDIEEIRTQKVTLTIKEIKECLMDQELISFFTELVK